MFIFFYHDTIPPNRINRLKDSGEVEFIFLFLVIKFNAEGELSRENSQAKVPNLDETLESHFIDTEEAILVCYFFEKNLSGQHTEVRMLNLHLRFLFAFFLTNFKFWFE